MKRFLAMINFRAYAIYVIGLMAMLAPFTRYNVPTLWQLPALLVWFFFAPNGRKERDGAA